MKMQFKLDDNYYSKFVGFCPLNGKATYEDTDIRLILHGELHKTNRANRARALAEMLTDTDGII